MTSSPRQSCGAERDAAGYLPIEEYGALGDGRAVALSGADGSIDWWCVPNIDSPPLFDRLLDPDDGGRFVVAPDRSYTVERRYREDSNVLETVFATEDGRGLLTESLNSGTAGRLPWAELARRMECVEGRMTFAVDLRFSRHWDTVNPYLSRAGHHDLFHVGTVLGLFLRSDNVRIDEMDDTRIRATVTLTAGERATVAIVAGENEPLIVPPIADIDARIDRSDQEWRDWVALLRHDGPHRGELVRSALALKLLLYSPTGAIVAAATTSLPEGIGGPKNWDYRFAWIRDAGYTIKAFLRIGAWGEAKAALTWLLQRLGDGQPQVCYTVGGDRVPPPVELDVPGWRASRPVVLGNIAGDQHQHGIYGDIFETAGRFVACGNVLDSASAETLSHLADECADRWRLKDAGIWELPQDEHYTMSKISCWQALQRAIELVDAGQMPSTCRDRWMRERDRIAAWIDEHCWSEARGAYVMYPGSDMLDASLALAVRFRFDGSDRLARTLDAIDRELGKGAFHYRYSGVEHEEGCFLACTFWMVEARALLGQAERAEAAFTAAMEVLGGCGVGTYAEMIDPETHGFLGNTPQGLTHLAIIQAIATLGGADL
ncbi:glycoside hydrolase family 15 protein [Sphingomonas sp. KR1UV-12]|uniref:Glycoside hydrolase family 15 protein n=1 Tax=Sphingomonas aurea TaxID=3063994 RepID=A0ABT9ELR1_9SPHN|nr:glycoside hydrolase family 15 protein [Sphingomonas sp. KR1UV-12]MDP1027894.1 glycoside hydrolase family 15 protein [Sphingomonas sp. KR1UV-12]